MHCACDILATSVILLDSDLIVQYVNPAAESLLSISGSCQLGLPIQDLLPYDRSWHHRLQQALVDDSGYTERGRPLQLSPQKNITVDLTTTPGTESGLKQLAIEMSRVDHHLRVSRENTRIHQQHATRELVCKMAHEIKNPLGGILGSAQLLERELPNDEWKEFTRIIINEAGRLQSLINRMLGPNQLPQPETFNIHEVLEHVHHLVSIEAADGICIRIDYDPSIPPLCADRDQLIQVFLNLLRNAMQSLDGSGNILIRSRIQRHLTLNKTLHQLVLKIDIIDDGPGITEELQPGLFFPMVSGRENGSGLGLSIAQHLVHQHRGLIEFESQPGDTVFTVYLPLGQK